MKMKRKGILLASAILGSVAIVSTGFAAWVITSPSTSTTAQGNIKVENVEDERVTLTATFEQSDSGNVSFGAPASQTAYANKWLENREGTAEDLNANFTLTAKKKDGSNAEGTITVAVKIQRNTTPDAEATWTDISTDSFNTANKDTKTTANVATDTKTLITLPVFEDSYTLNNGKVDVTATFDWGTAFGGDNPYDYYNAMTIAEEDFDNVANSALYNLGKLDELLENTRFVFTVKYTAAAE